jgi:hypothetical protein
MSAELRGATAQIGIFSFCTDFREGIRKFPLMQLLFGIVYHAFQTICVLHHSAVKEDRTRNRITPHRACRVRCDQIPNNSTPLTTTWVELCGFFRYLKRGGYAHLAPAHKLAAVDRLVEYRNEQEKAEAPAVVA